MKVSDFVKALQDKDLGYDKQVDKLIYSDAGLVSDESPAAAAMLEAAAATSGSVAPGGADPIDVSLAFKLHSRPGAVRKLLLDFNGHTTTGTVWNANWGLSVITSPPYDADGNPAAFSDTELRNIIFMWRQVAEDFAPFDVSPRVLASSRATHSYSCSCATRAVQTLLAPPLPESARARCSTACARLLMYCYASPTNQVDVTTEETDAAGNPINLSGIGARAVIGGASTDWYSAYSSGGTGYVGTFGQAYYEPAFIFPVGGVEAQTTAEGGSLCAGVLKDKKSSPLRWMYLLNYSTHFAWILLQTTLP